MVFLTSHQQVITCFSSNTPTGYGGSNSGNNMTNSLPCMTVGSDQQVPPFDPILSYSKANFSAHSGQKRLDFKRSYLQKAGR
jgi:hypothetical protein